MATIAVPIKIKVRELYGKIWLSLHLLEDGHRVAIGDQRGINNNILYNVQPDLYIAKSARFKRYNWYKRLKDTGCKLGVLDAEGGAFDASYAERNLSEEMLELFDFFLAWGEASKSAIENEITVPSVSVYKTGHPRFDLLQPQLQEVYRAEADRLKEKFGDYVLFNTNFGSINTLMNPARDNTIEDLGRNSDHWYEANLLLAFLSIINTLDREGNQDSIVVRPHPAEDNTIYQQAFDDSSSVVVDHTGDVRPWILGADAVVHNNCTTGLEAALLDVPVIAYEPTLPGTAETRAHTSNSVSQTLEASDEVVDRVNEIQARTNDSTIKAEQKEILKRYFENTNEPAAPKIADVISAELIDGKQLSFPSPSIKERLKSWIKQQPVAPQVQKIGSTLLPRQDTYSRSRPKFDGLTPEEIREVFTKLCDITGFPETKYTIERIDHMYDSYVIEKE